MKIALVQCPGWGRDCPPYAMVLLGAILKKAGHKVDYLDINNALFCSGPDKYRKFWDDKDLYSFWSSKKMVDEFIKDNKRMLDYQVDRILSSGVKMVGFTVQFSSLILSLELAKRIKQQDNSRIIVFGGPDCSRELRGLEIARNKFVDIVCVGEGEEVIVDVASLIEGENRLEFIKGTLIKAKDSFIDCGDRKVIKGLDDLPFPDYKAFEEDISCRLYAQPERLDIFDSRGCPRQCHFCSEWQYWKNFRFMSGDKMFSEVCNGVKNFPGVDYFYFIGSLLNGNLKALSRFCDLVIEHDLNIRWAGQVIIRPEMDKELLQKMKLAGCEWLSYGVESGSQRVLNKMNKRFSLQVAEEVIRNTHLAGINQQVNFMFGFPTETEVEADETINLLKKIRKNIDSVLASQSFCVIDKGTYIYEHPEEFSLIDKEHHLFWESKDNTYLIRFNRYEKFCKEALALGLPETSGLLRNKPDKWSLLGEYHLYKKDYENAIVCFKKAFDKEFLKENIQEKINKCRDLLSQETLVIEKPSLVSFEVKKDQILQDHSFLSDRYKDIACYLLNHGLDLKLKNFLLVEKEKMQRKEVLSGYPYWCVIDPANYCNLKCPFCPTGQGRNSRFRSILSLDNYKRIIEEIGPYLIHIDFCNWGEPFLNPNIFEMIRLAKEYDIDTKVDSNFNLLTENDLDRLIASGLDKVIVSIDGVSEETYSKYRVGGNYYKAMDNMKKLIEKKRRLNSLNPQVHWQFLVFRHNEHEIEQAKRIADNLGVDHLGITKAFIGNKDWFPENKEYSNYHGDTLKDVDSAKDTALLFKDSSSKICYWPWEAIAINPNGSVSVCCSVEEEKDDFGNIFNQPFNKLWNNDKYVSARRFLVNRGNNGHKHSEDNICFRCKHIGMINISLASMSSFQ
ncbi:MAG: radical SAM protein [Candidatus Gygaella obscura]|nr:radical SAM protein [Candidatus Gygaella obscura]